MESLPIIIISVVLLFLIFSLLYFIMRKVDVRVEEDAIVFKHLFSTKRVGLSTELKEWEVQRAYYLKLGVFYSITLTLKSGRKMTVNSLTHRDNYKRLYNYLNTQYQQCRVE